MSAKQITASSTIEVTQVTLLRAESSFVLDLTDGDSVIATLKTSSLLFDRKNPLTVDDFEFNQDLDSISDPEQQQQIVAQFNSQIQNESLIDNILNWLFGDESTVVIHLTVVDAELVEAQQGFEITTDAGVVATQKAPFGTFPLTGEDIGFADGLSSDEKESFLHQINDCTAKAIIDLTEEYPGLTFKDGEWRYHGQPLTPEQQEMVEKKLSEKFNKHAIKANYQVRMIHRTSQIRHMQAQSARQQPQKRQNRSSTKQQRAGNSQKSQEPVNDKSKTTQKKSGMEEAQREELNKQARQSEDEKIDQADDKSDSNVPSEANSKEAISDFEDSEGFNNLDTDQAALDTDQAAMELNTDQVTVGLDDLNTDQLDVPKSDSMLSAMSNVEDVADAAEGVTDAAKDAAEGVTDAAKDAAEGVTDAVEGVTDAAKDAVEGVTDAAKDAVEGVTNAVSNIPSPF